jgi:hypothetical protein
MADQGKDKQTEILRDFIQVYCRENHGHAKGLCDECKDLLDYAMQRLRECRLDPKPKCKDCPAPCYAPSYRERIRRVMRFSGMYFIKRGRMDWLVEYFLA